MTAAPDAAALEAAARAARGVGMAGEDLAALIEEQGARLEQQLNDSINALERTTAEGAELT